MPVTTGNVIFASEWTALRNNLIRTFGTGDGINANSGYNQTLTTPTKVSGDIIDDAEWDLLLTEINKCRSHQSGAAFSSVDLPPVNVGDGISKAVYDKYETALNTVFTNRTTYFYTGNFTDGLGVQHARTFTWTGSLVHRVTVSFTSAAAMQYYFNAGGEIRTTASLTGIPTTGGTVAKNQSWQNMLGSSGSTTPTGMGTVCLRYTDTVFTGTGTGTAIGWADLTGAYQTIATKTASGVYVANDYTVRAYKNATQVFIEIQFNDDYTGDGGSDEAVSGTLTSQVRFLYPDNVIVLPAPTAANTTTF